MIASLFQRVPVLGLMAMRAAGHDRLREARRARHYMRQWALNWRRLKPGQLREHALRIAKDYRDEAAGN